MMNSKVEPPATSSSVTNPGFEAVYRILQDAVSQGAFPGCAFGVLSDQEVVLQDSVGHFTYDPASPEVNADTVYDIASVTKVVATTAIAMLLYQRGILDLETPLAELLPGFIVGRSPSKPARHVTVRNLLAHNSGLPGYAELFRTAHDPAAILRACLQMPLQSEPGERMEYSDIGFILLGKALEVLTGESLAGWLDSQILGPLGMENTGFTPASFNRRYIPPTEDDQSFRKRVIQGEVQDENAWCMGGVAGHAGLFSNVLDLLRFAGTVTGAGRQAPGSPADIFNLATVELFARRQDPPGSSRALGWDTPSENSSAGQHFSENSIGHLGYSGCSLWIDLDAKVSVVLLTNRTWPHRQSQQIKTVRPAFHNAVREALAGVS